MTFSAGDSDVVINYQSRNEAPFEGVSFTDWKQTDFDGINWKISSLHYRYKEPAWLAC